MKYSWLLILILGILPLTGTAQTTSIEGFAPSYVGQKVEIFAVEDYLSMKEKLIATTLVEADSTFRVEFENAITQKIIVRSKKNKGFLYIQPAAKYSVFLPLKNADGIARPMGNDVEISFYDLDSSDINYQIISFNKWVNSFILTYHNRYKKEVYNSHFQQFKSVVEDHYKSDTSTYLKTYVRYSINELEELNPIRKLHRYELYDAFIKDMPVQYENDKYMSYINKFYTNVFGQLNMENNNRVYLGLLKNSPSTILNALSKEYTLAPTEIQTPQGKKYYGNLRLREYVMIKGLAEVFNSPDFPKTNILSVLDSLSKHAIFTENRVIARNVIFRLKELVPGIKAPDFVVTNQKGELKNLQRYAGKYLYLHFFNATHKDAVKELELLKTIHAKYAGEVSFVSIYLKDDNLTKKQRDEIAKIPWDVVEISEDDKLITDYQVTSYPYYVLMDVSGYIISAPALGPKPNNEYLTIDKVFFDIKKVIERSKNN